MTGTQFLATSIANLHAEVAAQIDAGLAKDARIAELQAEVEKLKAEIVELEKGHKDKGVS